jgi:hypothetical protein
MKHLLALLALSLVLVGAGITTLASARSRDQDRAAILRRTTPATGPLRVSRANPRYFSDESGRPIYLTGSHLGWELQDNAWGGQGEVFDYDAYLDLFANYNLNFSRMWVVETTRDHDKDTALTTPMPYKRAGPGRALDGELKFDLRQFNPVYFNRLRSRVMAARDRGIYVMVMLFQGFSIESKGSSKRDPWSGHPYNFANNINGINGDLNGNGEGEEVHTLKIPVITRLQEAYVTKVIDTLNDLDNVLYEIANESHNRSIVWQYHMIRFIQTYQKKRAKEHPVVMTVTHFKGGDNSVLFKSPAAAISPTPYSDWGYRDNPPAANGSKVVINDTDHLFGMENVNHQWAWKSFLRGLNPIFLDYGISPRKPDSPKWQLIRRSLGYTREYADRVDLAAMVPRGDLASTEYCLAAPGLAYLVYLPNGGSVSVNLRAATGPVSVEWFSPSTGETIDAGTIEGGASTEFTSPFTRRFNFHWVRRNVDRLLRVFGAEEPVLHSDAVLYLTANKATTEPQ